MQTVGIVCVIPPVINRAEGVKLWEQGDTATVVWSGYWQGMLDRGMIACIAAGPNGQQVLPDALPARAPVQASGVEAAVESSESGSELVQVVGPPALEGHGETRPRSAGGRPSRQRRHGGRGS